VIQRNFPAPAWLDLKTFAPQPEHVVDVVTTEALTSRDPVEALRILLQKARLQAGRVIMWSMPISKSSMTTKRRADRAGALP